MYKQVRIHKHSMVYRHRKKHKKRVAVPGRAPSMGRHKRTAVGRGRQRAATTAERDAFRRRLMRRKRKGRGKGLLGNIIKGALSGLFA